MCTNTNLYNAERTGQQAKRNIQHETLHLFMFALYTLLSNGHKFGLIATQHDASVHKTPNT
jgi:hypothetical protein